MLREPYPFSRRTLLFFHPNPLADAYWKYITAGQTARRQQRYECACFDLSQYSLCLSPLCLHPDYSLVLIISDGRRGAVLASAAAAALAALGVIVLWRRKNHEVRLHFFRKDFDFL